MTIQRENCDLAVLGHRFLAQNFIYGVGKNSPVAEAETISYWIAFLRESGFLRQLQTSYFVDSDMCSGSNAVAVSKEIDVDAMIGIFLVLILAGGVIIGIWVVDMMQHRAFLQLLWARVDSDESGHLDESEIIDLLLKMGLTQDATPEDPKTLEQHMHAMTSYTAEPGVRFSEFSQWWEHQPYALRVSVFKNRQDAKGEDGRASSDNPLDKDFTEKELGNDEFRE